MNKEELITIFTATYNRGALLRQLFKSLQEQTYLNFEWIIVDDGSTDNTEYAINQMKDEVSFTIIYEKQINQGKHIAINKGVSLANGSYFFIVDSDDRLPTDSLEIIASKLTEIRENDSVAGVVGLKCFFDQKIVGTDPSKNEVICDIFDYRYKYNVKGDRAEVFKTSVLKKYPFPKFDNEKFIPESIVWNRIGQDYKMLFFNENVYECEYLKDGLSAQSIHLRRKYPKGVLRLYSELGKIKKTGFVNRGKTYTNFWRFYFCDMSNAKENVQLLNGKYSAFLWLPLGLMLYVKDGVFINRKK